ncbi:MAG TPA: hypothetical protein VG078_06040 [Acidimicrobiales bacterium]|nr:hypothetical protein [Acidimicrobiales bacterium]
MRDLAARFQHVPYLRLGLAIALVAILAADVYLLADDEGTPVSLENAVERFRSEGGPVVDAVVPPTTEAPPAPATSSPPPSTTTTTRPAARSPAPPPPAPGAEAPRPATLLRPAAGVYRYRTVGSESISLLGASRRYPAETTRTVRHGGGCSWTMRLSLLAEHEEEHSFCSTAATLDATGNTTNVSWFGFSSTVVLVCDQPLHEADRGAAPGTTTPFACRQGVDSTFSGTTTIGGEESVPVDGQPRKAWRVQIRGTFDGQTRGTVTVSELVDQEDGSVLFEQRTTQLTQRSPLGDVAYRQEATFTLVSRTPTT